ncbi:MAG: glutamine--fructose-6-phosphate transaminase (isomerizing) [Oscillospiraceae bacterium]|jgi:glucosamine--fructose-6-phosphate aminotransferase (isomerizing)|nr:glutamine--fructose-6-phosphate transaminase (isomerizing) [Oscillospiraceae bacterium]
MCGIVGYTGARNAADILVGGLTNLEYRGYDSAGISILDQSGISTIKAKGRLQELACKIKEVGKPGAGCGIGHTRWATHGEPSDINSHPHRTPKLSMVHNGIIENYLEIKKFLSDKGYTFESQTDTETAVKLVDYFYKGDPFDAIHQALERLEGSYAFGILFADQPDTIYAVRKDSPLIVGLGENENYIASDVPAILEHTRDFYLLDEMEIAVIKPGSVVILDLTRAPVKKERMRANWDIAAAQKGGYPHFMLKEICEQPKALTDTVHPRIRHTRPDFSADDIPADFWSQFDRVHITACGTAMYAGTVGKVLLERLARIPVDVDLASEFRYRDPILTDRSLVIVISQSGETADSLAAMRLAKSRGITTLAIVNVIGSSIAREADFVLHTYAGPEIAVASTKAFSVQIAMMYLIAIDCARIRGMIDDAKTAALTADLTQAIGRTRELLDLSGAIESLAPNFMKASSLFYLGRGLDYALAMEGSLKLKEISYIHSEAYAAGELKHGTISLITDGVPVVALVTQRELLPKIVSNIREVRARGGHVVVITKSGFDLDADIYDEIIRLPDVDDFFMPLLAVIALQFFAYYIAVARGCDVDKPRNLAKSVTVE